MRVECVAVQFPAFGLEPGPKLAHGRLDGALAGISTDGHTRLEHHEIPAFQIAGRDQIVDRYAGVQIKAQAGGVFSAAIGLLRLQDERSPGRHGAAVAGEYLVRELRVRRQDVHRDARLPVGVDHLRVLPAGGIEIETQSQPCGARGHRIAGLPREVIDGSDQHVAQHAVFAVDSPAAGSWRAAALDARAQLHVRVRPPPRAPHAAARPRRPPDRRVRPTPPRCG